MSILTTLKKYMTVGITFLIVASLTVVFFLARCAIRQRAEINGLKAEIQQRDDYVKFLNDVLTGDKKTDEKVKKQITKINNISKPDNITRFLNSLYKNGLQIPSGDNTDTRKTDTTENKISK